MKSPRDTPAIPAWIKAFRDERTPPRFLNIFDECSFPESWHLHDSLRPALFGTESMYGRWSDARVLILARDAGSKWNFIPATQGGRGFPWVHDESRPTNYNLRPYADRMNCQKLFGSAMSCLVLNTAQREERVPLRPLLDARCARFAQQVLEWTLDNLPSLNLVICLGKDSWDLTMQAVGDPKLIGDFASNRGCSPNICNPARAGTRFGTVYHTSYVQPRSTRDAEWRPILDAVSSRSGLM